MSVVTSGFECLYEDGLHAVAVVRDLAVSFVQGCEEFAFLFALRLGLLAVPVIDVCGQLGGLSATDVL